ncbi:uncharacterized protein [Miscanthus floridulus]|uniref:uncharacterized protein isoform X1 n=1 Tax=Miscanthus floridulus TaxID=154761 RepID=UPI003458F519
MGSLMSGWSSSVLSDKEVHLMRNRSLTKDDVAAFWRQQHGRPTAPKPNAGSPRAVRYCCTSLRDNLFDQIGEIIAPYICIAQLSLSVHQEMLVPLAAKRRLEAATRSLPPLPGRGGGTRSNDDDLKCCSAYGYGAGDQQLVSSRSEPATARGEGFFLPENAAADSSGTSRGWWTRSSWAFLNEPPPPTREEVLLGRALRSFHADRIVITGNA